ncbi:DinB family protein [Roseivirga sp. UBA838]|uniref:DinB family protein n=1 Tax=Roseivirga sp. UBA838 TaxID=1947393 RepID=UPI00257AF34A|nr:DinB family protein [Roseivirga sp. UBA838]|tara:strand:+ start:105190 stop:105675 length:486 start_codon:yes stop_codon:yes gene_type:complete
MKIAKTLTYTFFALLITTGSAMADHGGYDWLKQRLEASKAYTLAVLEAMPEESYNFKPNDEQRTFAAQAYHIAYSIDYFHRAFANGGQAQWAPGDENSKSKKELIEWAKTKFDEMNAFILAQENNDQLTAGLISYLDHNAHHRGQIVTYLRMKGINPPQYR